MQNPHLNEIKNLLRQMQTEEVATAEANLAKYAQFPGYVQTLLGIMRDPSNQQWLKTITAASLNNTLSNYAQEKTNQVSQILKKVIFDSSIKQLDKRSFEKSMIRMINQGEQRTNHGILDVRNQWLFILGELLKYKANFDSAYLVLASFAVGDEVPSVVLRSIVQNYFEPIISSLEVCVQNANLLNQMIKMWIVIFDSLRREDENNETLYCIANSQKLLDLLDLIYELESIEGVLVCVNVGLAQLNLLKYEAAQLNKRLLLFSEENNVSCRTLNEYSRKNFNRFARTLHALSQQRQHLDVLGCEDMLTTYITIQKIYMAENYEQFSYEVAVSLVQHQIFPYLPLNDEERQKFEECPQDFNSLAEDCCDKQTYGILKTQAVKLLETIGDKIEGALKYILNRAIDSVKVGLGFVAPQLDQSVLPVETALLVLSVFSYGIGRYEAQIAALKVIFCDERIKAVPPIQMSRVFTFLAYNYNQLYKNPSEGQNWIGFALTYHTHPTARYSGFDFLSNTVDEYFNEIYLSALINEIATSQVSLIWDITTKIIESHFRKISTQGFILIITKLFERIKLQVELIQKKEKPHTLDLNNCIDQFSVILTSLKENLSEEGENSDKYQKILACVWPITELYRPALQWDLQDEVVKVVINIINVIPTIDPALHILVPQFITAFKANGYIEKVYLRFFNEFALKANFQRDQQPLIEIIVALKNALMNSLSKVYFPENGKLTGSQQERIIMGNIFIVLQNVLAVHGTSLLNSNSLDFFNQIGSICLRLLPNPNQTADPSSTGRIIMSRALNTLFLCHMHAKTECLYDYLTRLKGLNLYHGHDTLIFTLCVSKEIFRETDISILTLLIESLMQIIQKSNQKEENLTKKKKGKSKIKSNAQLKKITDMDKILRTISSPFGQNLSVGQEVIKLFSTMHAGNAEMVNQILKTITPESLSTVQKYVDLQNLGKKKRVYRKVVGLKQGPGVIEAVHTITPTKINEDIEDNSDQQAGPKRQRVKLKTQKKKNTARKINPRN